MNKKNPYTRLFNNYQPGGQYGNPPNNPLIDPRTGQLIGTTGQRSDFFSSPYPSPMNVQTPLGEVPGEVFNPYFRPTPQIEQTSPEPFGSEVNTPFAGVQGRMAERRSERRYGTEEDHYDPSKPFPGETREEFIERRQEAAGATGDYTYEDLAAEYDQAEVMTDETEAGKTERFRLDSPVPLLAGSVEHGAYAFGKALGTERGTPGRGLGMLAGAGKTVLGLGRNIASGMGDARQTQRVYADGRRRQDELMRGPLIQDRSQFVDPSNRYAKYGKLFNFQDGGMQGDPPPRGFVDKVKRWFGQNDPSIPTPPEKMISTPSGQEPNPAYLEFIREQEMLALSGAPAYGVPPVTGSGTQQVFDRVGDMPDQQLRQDWRGAPTTMEQKAMRNELSRRQTEAAFGEIEDFQDGGEMMMQEQAAMEQQQGETMPQNIEQEATEIASNLISQLGPDIQAIQQFLVQEDVSEQMVEMVLMIVQQMLSEQSPEEELPELSGSTVMRDTMNRRMDMPIEFRAGGKYPKLK